MLPESGGRHSCEVQLLKRNATRPNSNIVKPELAGHSSLQDFGDDSGFDSHA
jgi:hypothetical protein